MKTKSIQEQNQMEHCFGCGQHNEHGLQIKSYWDGEESVCSWQAKPHHSSVNQNIVCGGIIASLIDCHSVNLAIAQTYKNEHREPGSEPIIKCLTAQLDVSYLKPTPIDKPLTIRARVVRTEGRKTWLECEVIADQQVCARGKVLAVRINS